MNSRPIFVWSIILSLMAMVCACQMPGEMRWTPTTEPTATATPLPFFMADTAQPSPTPVRFVAAARTPLAATAAYDYLPRLAQRSSRALRQPATVTLGSQRLQVALVALKDPESAPAALEPGMRLFVTTYVITNTSEMAVQLTLPAFFQGMNSSGQRLDAGGRVQVQRPESVLIPPRGQEAVDLLWKTEVYGEDMWIWLTANMPILSSGYVLPSADGAVYAFRLADVGRPPAGATPCTMSARFVRETIDDDTVFAPGERFEKTWVIANNGTCPWIKNSVWAHFSGEAMGVTAPLPLATVAAPGELLTVTVPMTAPLTPGTYRGDWRLRAPSGEFYCRAFYLRIIVREPTATPSPAP